MPTIKTKSRVHRHFITGRLAETALREIVDGLSEKLDFEYSIQVMPITVAALMTSKWMGKRWEIPSETTEVILPGHCTEGIETLQAMTTVPIRCGPKDLRNLPEYFGAEQRDVSPGFGDYDIQILAEINHAGRFDFQQLVHLAQQLLENGADQIDIGCEPGRRWQDVGEAIGLLVQLGIPVSIDSFDPWEVEQACQAGASLVLSVNSENRHLAPRWNSEVVAIPDTPDDLDSLYRTVDYLSGQKVPFRLDPILEPIGMGFAASLQRYATVRQRYPETKMMMGIGNLTELTDVDSAGINVLLLGICQELRIDSVLTTQVIHWAQSSVRECDLARRLVHYAVQHRVPPKHLDSSLVTLRDGKPCPFPAAGLEAMARQLKDNHYRLYAQNDQIHLLAAGLHLAEKDPFLLFERLLNEPQSDNVDAGHAFYLGYEMAKAVTALTLQKQYEQDEAIPWGFLTQKEQHHRIQRTNRHHPKPSSS